VSPKNIAIIGDRLFTDIIVGNRCNIKTIFSEAIKKGWLAYKI